MNRILYPLAAAALLMVVTVSCKKKEVTSVALNKTELTLEVGDTATLTATVLPEDAENKAVTWKSNNPAVVAVDNNGKVTAKTAGTAVITVTTDDGNKTATCTVTVKDVFVEIKVVSVSLNKTELTLYVGDTATLIASVLPENADNKAVTWKSSNNTVAEVDDGGKITAKTVGSAVVTVTTEDGNKTATCNVTVKEKTIMDTLIGEWSWFRTYGGIGGNFYDNKFKSIIKILNQNEDASINYEVMVEDTLFYKGAFQVQPHPRTGVRTVNIKLPHFNPSTPFEIIYFCGLKGRPSKDTLCFKDDVSDGYDFFYERIK